MLGRLHQTDDSGCPRLPDSCAAIRLRQGECCCQEAEAILRWTGAEVNAASAASVERTRNFCPFAREPGTPAFGETLCDAWAGVRWGGRRPGAIRHLCTRGRPGN